MKRLEATPEMLAEQKVIGEWFEKLRNSDDDESFRKAAELTGCISGCEECGHVVSGVKAALLQEFGFVDGAMVFPMVLFEMAFGFGGLYERQQVSAKELERMMGVQG